MYGIAVGSVSDSLPTPLRSLFAVSFLYINQRKAKEAMTEEKLKEMLKLRIKILEQKLMKSIPAARNNEIRGEIIGLKWVLERL
jgi:hypothetical protein